MLRDTRETTMIAYKKSRQEIYYHSEENRFPSYTSASGIVPSVRITKMKVFTVSLLIVNSVLWNVECPPPDNNDIYAIDAAECRETIKLRTELRREVSCKPRETFVTLTPKSGVSYIPNVVSVKKCGGYCYNNLSCMPTEIKRKVFAVEGIQDRKCYRVYVNEHVNCGCGCSVMKHHCNQHQWYDTFSCACHCIDDMREDACRRQENMTWDPATCECTCVEQQEECSTGLEWIPSLCRCAKVMM